MPSIICDQSDCGHLATHAVKLCVPAMGEAQDESRAFHAVMAIRLCLAHAAEFKAAQIIDAPTPKGKGTFRDVLPIFARLQGRHEPDVDRAWIVPVALASAEFKDFEAAINRTSPP